MNLYMLLRRGQRCKFQLDIQPWNAGFMTCMCTLERSPKGSTIEPKKILITIVSSDTYYIEQIMFIDPHGYV